LVAINMLFAVALSGGFGHFFAINQYGGWALELEGLYFVAALAVALLGAGRLSIGGANGRFN
jgi:putative oxidoreductase